MQHVIYEAVFIRLSKISAMTQQFIWLKTFSDQWYLSLRKPILNIWNRLGGFSGQKFMNGRILLFIIRFGGFINDIYYNSRIIYFIGIQALFGQVKNRIGIGKHSVTVLEQLELLENCQQVTSGISREISTLIVVDRNLDYASALLSPLTYEALLNEVFKNTCGTIGKLQFLIILIFAKCTEIQRRKNIIMLLFLLSAKYHKSTLWAKWPLKTQFNFGNYFMSFFIHFSFSPHVATSFICSFSGFFSDLRFHNTYKGKDKIWAFYTELYFIQSAYTKPFVHLI